MPFGFFGKKGSRDAAPASPADARDDADEAAIDESDTVEQAESVDEDEFAEGAPEEGSPEDAPDIDWRARAAAILPTGSSTGSKRPEALWGTLDADAPTHFVRAMGCHVVATDGGTYVDCGMALGAVALGYAEPEVTQAVVNAATLGAVSLLSDVREVDVAERLHTLVPCAERAQFFKTGAEAMSAAVRVARTYTGRDVVVCSGYFGWHDWASESAGVPGAVRALTHHVPFDDVDALEKAAREAGDRLAAIVLEPVVERMPGEGWARAARALADELGAVLIFDEMKTGFRLRPGGYQELSGVTPDLAGFGKALANGYPLAALVGRADVMDALRRTWISSTLASEGTALAAAGAVLDWHERAEVCESLTTIGGEMRAAVQGAITASGIEGVELLGIDPMWLLRFADPARETRFLELAARQGVLFKRGAYNYAALAHADVIGDIEAAASAAFVELLEEESA